MAVPCGTLGGRKRMTDVEPPSPSGTGVIVGAQVLERRLEEKNGAAAMIHRAMTAATALKVTADALRLFEPTRLGARTSEFQALVQQFAGRRQSEIISELEKQIAGLDPDTQDPTTLAYRSTLVILRDYVLAGNYPVVSNGRLFLANFLETEKLTEASQRTVLRRRYEAARDRSLRDRGQIEWLSEHVRQLVCKGYSPHAVLALLQQGPPDIDLLNAKENKVGLDTRGLWRCVRATWSMTPEMSAPGREVAFVAIDRRFPTTPLGILQLRNVVPAIRKRDLWLGIAVESSGSAGFLRLVADSGEVTRKLQATADVIKGLLSSLNCKGIPFELSETTIPKLNDLVLTHRRLFDETRQTGQQGLKNEHLLIVKRAQTAQALLRGLRALSRLSRTGNTSTEKDVLKDLDAGLTKLWHYHMGFVALELSICGAAPPFGPIRIGKLMAALAGSAPVLDAWGADRPLGQISQEVYQPQVRERVPNLGPLVIFTSGLYPGHSAQYQRVRVGDSGWRKIGETTGYGNFNISVEAAEAMRRLNMMVDGYAHITRAFGEGSGARFRSAGRALGYLGLPDLRRHETQRPLYALSLVRNPREALLGWEDPVSTNLPSIEELSANWWQRWIAPRAAELAARSRSAEDLEAVLGAIVGRGSRQSTSESSSDPTGTLRT